MGSRAEIVVIDEGAQRRYYTHWGAQSLHLDLLPGVLPALRFAAAQKHVEGWVGDLEAAAVIDVDNRFLLWFAGGCEESAIRSAVFETMSVTWPDWCIHWAGYREADLIDYCAGRWPQCVVTVSDVERVRLYTPAIDLATLLEQGPALIEIIAGWNEAKRLPTMPKHGLHLDLAQQSGAVWTFGGSSDALETIADQWPGWRWEDWGDRAVREAVEADSGPDPELAGAFETLSESFTRHQQLDTGTEAAAELLRVQTWMKDFAQVGGFTLETIEDNAFAHRPVELTPAELADAYEAIAAAALRARPTT
ncbi:hypothetical protein D5S18_15590 [Nocardia panacis]|uniref:DUF4123 domain-containing protein n=1 Tax=Nocardia panacis TaxID=2340916 RepID=A0A3A4K786_9NOCA|nr:hypothetical protein [Nocardia panacis]RJO74854.1 hypothetical protein D5S18_15590 [Nocardia panacis]